MKFGRTAVYYLIYPFVRFAFFLLNPVFTVCGKENIPKGGYILCCNHSNWTDPIWLIFAIRPRTVFRFFAKIELSRIPVIGLIMNFFGVIFVDRGHHDTAAMEHMRGALQEGEQAMIFPEGTRIHKGQKGTGKPGAIQLAQECCVPILPVYLTQDKKLFHRVKCVIGKPYDPVPDFRPIPRESMKVLAEELRIRIYKLGDNA